MKYNHNIQETTDAIIVARGVDIYEVKCGKIICNEIFQVFSGIFL